MSICCNYCGHSWEEFYMTSVLLASQRCPICRDKKLKVKDINDVKIDTYAGSPPFAAKKLELVVADKKDEPEEVVYPSMMDWMGID